MRKLILLIVMILMTSSCVILRNQTRLYFINADIIQVIDSNTAFALTEDNHEIIKVVTTEEIYFDGRPIIGIFVLVDTYAYISNSGKYTVVPVYIRYSEFQKYKRY